MEASELEKLTLSVRQEFREDLCHSASVAVLLSWEKH